LAKRLTKIFHGANDSIEETYATYFSKIEQELIEMGLNLKTIVEHNLKAIEKKRHNLKSLHSAKLLNSVQSDILNNGRRLLINFKKDGLGTLELNLRQGIQNSFILHKRILDECPETQALYYKPGARESCISSTLSKILFNFSLKVSILSFKLLRNSFSTREPINFRRYTETISCSSN